MARAKFSSGDNNTQAPSGSLDLFQSRQIQAMQGGDITEIVQKNKVFNKQDSVRVPRNTMQLPDDPYWHSGRDGDGGGGGGQGGGQGQQRQRAQPGNEPGEEQEGEGGQEAGNSAADELTMSNKEFLEMFLGPFELPNWERKDLLDEKDMRWRRKGTQRRGSMGRLDKRQTARRRIRRAAAHKAAHREQFPGKSIPGSKVVPFDSERDYRFGKLVPQPEPDANAAFFFMLDGSYSTEGEPLLVAQYAFFVLQKALRLRYKRVVIVMVSHTTVPIPHKTEQTFFTLDAKGGTEFAATYVWSLDEAKRRFPKSKYCRYWAHFTDGDNSGGDKEPTKKALIEMMLKEFNHAFYMEYHTYKRTTKTTGMETIDELPPEVRQHISTVTLNSRKELRAALRKLLGIDK